MSNYNFITVFKNRALDVIYILLFVSFCIALFFLIVFLLMVRKGEFDDLDAPPIRMLFKQKKRTP